MIEQRKDPQLRTTLGDLVIASALILPIMFAANAGVSSESLPAIAALVFVSAFPLAHDWARHRAIADGKMAWVLVSDIGRLAGVLIVIGTVLRRSNPVQIQGYLLSTAIIGILVLLPVMRSTHRRFNYRNYAYISGWQTVEFLVSQLITTVPLWFLGVVGKSAVMGAFRLAQSWLGPVNLVNQTITTNLLAYGGRHGADDLGLVGEGRRLSRFAGAVSIAVTIVAVVVAAAFGDSLVGVNRDDLLIGVICVGLAVTAAGGAGVQLMVMRILRHQRYVTRVRLGVLISVWSGFLVGYSAAGIGGSLVAGFLASAIAYAFFGRQGMSRLTVEVGEASPT